MPRPTADQIQRFATFLADNLAATGQLPFTPVTDLADQLTARLAEPDPNPIVHDFAPDAEHTAQTEPGAVDATPALDASGLPSQSGSLTTAELDDRSGAADRAAEPSPVATVPGEGTAFGLRGDHTETRTSQLAPTAKDQFDGTSSTSPATVEPGTVSPAHVDSTVASDAPTIRRTRTDDTTSPAAANTVVAATPISTDPSVDESAIETAQLNDDTSPADNAIGTDDATERDDEIALEAAVARDELDTLMDSMDLPIEQIQDVEAAVAAVQDEFALDPELHEIISSLSENELAEALTQALGQAAGAG